MILRVEFNEPDISIEDIFPDDLAEVQILEHEKGKEDGKESETYTYFVKILSPRPDLTAVGGYISLPYDIRGGKARVTFLGSAKQVKDFIKLFDQAGIRTQIISLTDAKFPPHSPLNRLTEKQRRVFITAYNLGYYDVPRKIGLVQLAERLHLAHSTLGVQLRRAERRLLNHIMGES